MIPADLSRCGSVITAPLTPPHWLELFEESHGCQVLQIPLEQHVQVISRENIPFAGADLRSVPPLISILPPIRLEGPHTL